MKKLVFGISITGLILAAGASQIRAAEDESPTVFIPPPADTTVEASPAETGPAPASIEKLKETIDAINANSSGGLKEVVRLNQAGVDKTVIETYIRNSRLSAPTPKDLIYLHDQGIPEEVIKALIEHGREMQASSSTTVGSYGNAPAAGTSTDPSTGNTYNNYVYNWASAPTPSYSYDTAAQNNSVVIVPYNPYRNYYQSYYSPPFYSCYNYPWYNSYYGYNSSYSWYYPSSGYWPYYNSFYSRGGWGGRGPYLGHRGFAGSIGFHRR